GGEPAAGRVARRAADPAVGHRPAGHRNAHGRHARCPAADQAARPVGPADAGSHRHRPRPRLHGRAGPGPARRGPGPHTMSHLLRGKPGGLLAFAAIALLVAGGLGWATAAALRLEREQLEARAEAELAGKLRLALWRLDSLVGPILARENSRPYN